MLSLTLFSYASGKSLISNYMLGTCLCLVLHFEGIAYMSSEITANLRSRNFLSEICSYISGVCAKMSQQTKSDTPRKVTPGCHFLGDKNVTNCVTLEIDQNLPSKCSKMSISTQKCLELMLIVRFIGSNCTIKKYIVQFCAKTHQNVSSKWS